MSKAVDRIIGGVIFSPSVQITSGAPTSSAFTLSGVVANPGGSASGLTVTINKNGSALGTATTNSAGAWSYPATGAANGDVFTASAAIAVTGGSSIAAIAAAPVYTINSALTNLAAAVAARRASPSTVRQARILTFGHSHVEGAGAGSNDLVNTSWVNANAGVLGCVPNNWTTKLPGSLGSKLKTLRHGWLGNQRIGDGYYNIGDMDPGRITLGAGWLPPSGGDSVIGCCQIVGAANSAGYLDFTPGFAVTSIKIWLKREMNTSNCRSLGVYADGVQIATLDTYLTGSTTGGVDNKDGHNWAIDQDVISHTWKTGWRSTLITGISNASKISVKNLDPTYAVSVFGIECFGPATDAVDVVITQAGWGGSTTDKYLVATNNWNIFPQVRQYVPDLIIFYSANNDIAASVPAATWASNVQTVLANNPNSDFILVLDPIWSGLNPTLYPQYRTAANAIIGPLGATLTGIGLNRGMVVDLAVPACIGTTYADGHDGTNLTDLQGNAYTPPASLWHTDATHVSATGQSRIADYLATKIVS